MVWQLSIANGFLSSTSPDTSMTFRFPIEIAKDLVSVTGQFSKQSLEVHGIGLVIRPSINNQNRRLTAAQIEKIFDVACTLIDVMSCVPIESRKFEPGPQEYLNQLLMLISTLRGGEARFLPLVMTKIRDTLPAISMALPQQLVMKAANMGGQKIKQESNSSSPSSSPYSTPPFMHRYPLA